MKNSKKLNNLQVFLQDMIFLMLQQVVVRVKFQDI